MPKTPTGEIGGAAGGAAQADFDTLMNLIQQTVDPDSWLSQGGTSNILPYPSGVFIDPQGMLRHVEVSGDLSTQLASPASQSQQLSWRTPSRLRVISLKELDAEIYSCALAGQRPTAEVLQLAGLSRIEFVQVDLEHEDVLLAGPAGDASLGFHLEDVAVVASLAGPNRPPLGCTIEPTDDGLRAAQKWLEQPGVLRQLARQPQSMTEQLQDQIGAHHVRVFGMNGRTATAVALVAADEHMKQVGFGTAKVHPNVRSYFDFMDHDNSAAAQSLVRWWFTYASQRIHANPQRDLFRLPDENVVVMSEQQWVGQAGRAPTGKRDPAADSFAAEFSSALPTLRASHRDYARLCAVFEAALATQLVVEATGQPSLDAWFPNLCGLGTAQSDLAVEPKSVAGLTTWHKLKNGTVVAVVSGGVTMDPRTMASRDQWQTSDFLTRSVVPTSPDSTAEPHSTAVPVRRWWWD
ncbi:DUF1598 domain-containing protein [Aureliella helgolandensis]|uniref:DUF1598 domain-containing protein n=1 Tax=Aureliella helgolandensis TaxID=2527968 RepID=UPI0018D13B68|nr:DUF1598 domain-containing protein [Aureliella helgolandensis]